jgi:hypothetical protein
VRQNNAAPRCFPQLVVGQPLSVALGMPMWCSAVSRRWVGVRRRTSSAGAPARQLHLAIRQTGHNPPLVLRCLPRGTPRQPGIVSSARQARTATALAAIRSCCQHQYKIKRRPQAARAADGLMQSPKRRRPDQGLRRHCDGRRPSPRRGKCRLPLPRIGGHVSGRPGHSSTAAPRLWRT